MAALTLLAVLSAPPLGAEADEGRPRGALTKEVIRRTINRGIGPIRTCFESFLQRHPDGVPKITVRFEIGPRGQVVSAEPVGEIKADPTLERCILDAVKALRFREPEGGGYVTVTYPFLVHLTGG